MSRTAILLVFLPFCFSCEDGDDNNTSSSVYIASLRCAKSTSEMTWLQELIDKVKNDATQLGDIYAGKYGDQVVFIHQPIVMSCLACVVYDCDGNRLDIATLDHEKLRLLINNWNVIYKAR